MGQETKQTRQDVQNKQRANQIMGGRQDMRLALATVLGRSIRNTETGSVGKIRPRTRPKIHRES